MNLFSSLSVRNKLIVLGILALLPMFLIGSISLMLVGKNVTRIENAAKEEGYIVIDLILNSDRDMYQALTAFQLFRYAGLPPHGQAQKLKDFRENVTQSKDRIKKAIDIFKNNESVWIDVKNEQTGKNVFDYYDNYIDTYQKWIDGVEAFVQGGRLSDSNWESCFEESREDINVIGELTDYNVEKRINSEFSKYHRLTVVVYFLMFINLLVVSFVIYFFIESITRPLKEMVKVVELLGVGDLTKTLKISGGQEIIQLGDGLNHAITNLRNLITDINEQAHVLATASKELSEASTESGRSASEVARAVESMAKASIEQTDNINQTVNNITQLGQLVKKVTNDSINIADSSKRVANSAQNGQQVSSNVAVDISQLFNTTQEISNIIHEISKFSEQINRITSLIEGFASQTTLLALNATIEAARAGDYGRGFGVVASETGKLAEQSKQSSKDISVIILEMLNRSKNAVKAIQKGVTEVEASKQLSTEAAVTFGTIYKELEDTLVKIQNVALSAQTMAQHNDQVIEAISNVAAISEEAMASTEEISASVEQQSASAQEVAALANNLSKIAESMQKSVATFKI
jgi:methyl-accepting chemotaxis protein